MKVLTYRSYKEHFELYTESHGPIAVTSSQIEPVRKDIILLSDVAVMLYKACSRTGVKNKHVKFALSAGRYSVDYFNGKFKVAVTKQKQDWEAPQIKD